MICITIALTRYNEPDELLKQCLESIASQKGVQALVIVLDQKTCLETHEFCKIISSVNIVFEYHDISACGCAHARNIAIHLCKTDILLWTDPDIILPSDWAYQFYHALSDENCDIIGGKIIPHWHRPPRWYMKTNIMMDQYSLLDLGDNIKEADRIIGGNMGINIKRLGEQAFFEEKLGRQKGTLLGGVDSEFCERAMQEGFKVCYANQVVAQHHISESRMRLNWIAKKFFYSGLSRGFRGGRPEAINKKREITDYIVLIAFAPFYLIGLLKGKTKKQTGLRPVNVNY